jgi:hypothetical protein
MLENVMIRTQVQLSEEQSALIKQVAAERNVSMAEIIRQGVDYYLKHCAAVGREERVQRALAAAGRFGSGRSDVSARHDAHLAEAYKP